MSTALILTGARPASAAAAIPSSTSGSRSRRASLRNVSGRSVSSDTLIPAGPARGHARGGAAEPDPVGGQRDLRPRGQLRGARDDAGQPAPQQRLAASEPDLAD